MSRPSHPAPTPLANLSLALLLILSVALACAFKKPWRHYEQKPFNAKQWRDGDAITRGTMIVDLFRQRLLSGKSRDEVVELLGEPDKKTSSEGSEVWLYRIEVTGEKPRRYFPVSFDKEGRASAGRARGGTMSMVVDD